MKIAAEILAVCVLGGLAFTANTHAAQTKITDPRKCVISTPAYCASHAAARVAIATVKGTRKTIAPVLAHCDEHGSLLRWTCRLNDGGGHGWNVSVVYRGTPNGWRVRTRIL